MWQNRFWTKKAPKNRFLDARTPDEGFEPSTNGLTDNVNTTLSNKSRIITNNRMKRLGLFHLLSVVVNCWSLLTPSVARVCHDTETAHLS